MLADLASAVGDLGAHTFEIHAGKAYYDHGLKQGLEEARARVVLPTEGLSQGRKLAYYSSDAAGRPVVTRAGDPNASAERAEPMTSPMSSPAAMPSTGQYRPLFEHLRGLAGDRWDASFAEIEQVSGRPLPRSARRHSAWWANNGATYGHARAWLAAGYETSQLRLGAERVTFRGIAA